MRRFNYVADYNPASEVGKRWRFRVYRFHDPRKRSVHVSGYDFANEVRALEAASAWLLSWNTYLDTVADCSHVSVTTPDGHGAYCRHCGETLA